LLITLEAIILIILLTIQIKDPNFNSFSNDYTLSIGFILLGLIFLITGLSIISLLKASFPLFYEDNKNKLIMATTFLSIPMFLRTIWDATFQVTYI